MRTEDQIREVVSSLQGTLSQELKTSIDKSVFVSVVAELLEEKIADRIYQVIRDWEIQELATLALVVSAPPEPEVINAQSFVDETPKRKFKRKKEDLN